MINNKFELIGIFCTFLNGDTVIVSVSNIGRLSEKPPSETQMDLYKGQCDKVLNIELKFPLSFSDNQSAVEMLPITRKPL